jgi:hypothetical protein
MKAEEIFLVSPEVMGRILPRDTVAMYQKTGRLLLSERPWPADLFPGRSLGYDTQGRGFVTQGDNAATGRAASVRVSRSLG